MSTEDEPPSKRHKSEREFGRHSPSSSPIPNTILGQSAQSFRITNSSALVQQLSPSGHSLDLMSESKRRSSRKSRHDELLSNEQNIATGSSPTGSSQLHKQDTSKSDEIAGCSQVATQRETELNIHRTDTEKRATGDEEDEHDNENEDHNSYQDDEDDDDDDVDEEEEEEEEEEDDDDDEDDVDEEDEELEDDNDRDDANLEDVEATLDQARSFMSNRSRPGGFSLGAMASLFSSQSSQFKALLGSLREPDPSLQLVALSELANLLSMGTEDSLAGYVQVDAFVIELVRIMRGPDIFGEENPEMMLLACRCLANLMEALPSSTANVAYGGAIPVLCQKLLEIQFIDLAEQALSTLEKISKEYPASIVREGGMAACLTYLDFFSTNVQRIAVNTAANCAKSIPADSFPMIRDVVPTLQRIICGNDTKVVESGCLCLSRVIETFKNDADKLEELLNSELLRTLIRTLSPVQLGAHGVAEHIRTRFVQVLGLAAKASTRLTIDMLQQDLVGTIYELLTGLGKPASIRGIVDNSVVVLQALIHCSKEQIHAVLCLISEILPGLPEDTKFSVLTTKERGSDVSRTARLETTCATEYEEFVAIVLPTLLDIYNSSVNHSLRRSALVAVLKLCQNLNTEIFTRVVDGVPLAVFIAGVLGSRDQDLVLIGSWCATLLLERMENIYAHKLTVEGCVAELVRLEQKLQDNDAEMYDGDATNLETIDYDPSGQAGSLQVSQEMLKAVGHGHGHTVAGSVDTDMIGSADLEGDNSDSDEAWHRNLTSADDGASTGRVKKNEADAQLALTDTGTSAQADIKLYEVGVVKSRPQSRSSKFDSFVMESASAFMQRYRAMTQSVRGADTVLLELQSVAEQLQRQEVHAFAKLSQLLRDSENVSSYYLRASGVLDALFAVLTCNGCEQYELAFIDHVVSNSAFQVLVSKLQELLSRLENFEVTSASFADEKRSANILAKQLRLKLVAADGSDVPKPFRNLMVSIHAIATFKALDDYLRPRVANQPTDSPGKVSRSETPTNPRSSDSDLIKKSATLKSALEQLAMTTGNSGAQLPQSIRDRLASLGVDAGDLLGTLNEDYPSLQHDSNGVTNKKSETSSINSSSAVSITVPAGPLTTGERSETPLNSVTPSGTVTSNSKFSDNGGIRSTPSEYSPGQVHNRGISNNMSYAAAVSRTPQDCHIQFEVNGEIVFHEMTIYAAIRKSIAIGDVSVHGRPHASVYQVKFRRVAGPPPDVITVSDLHQDERSFANDLGEAGLILQLLNVLYTLNSRLSRPGPETLLTEARALPSSEFVNTKLTAKLNRQLEEPLIVASQCLPAWSQRFPRIYPFLFPFETRYLFLQSTSFGYSRSINRWQQAAKKSQEDSKTFLGRLQRQKVRISRPRMLESAIKVMELYGSSPSVLEVEYFEEVGTGLGPTLEFYSAVSKELCRRKLGIWREVELSKTSDYVLDPHGLFPRPLPCLESEQTEQTAETIKRTLALFRTMGTFMARAMIDSRIIDIPINSVLFKLLSRTGEAELSIEAIYAVDEILAKSLRMIGKLAGLPSESTGFDCVSTTVPEGNADPIRDLALDFTYPGAPEIELITNGSQVEVNHSNVAIYLSKVVDFTIGCGISRQLQAFKDGFSQVFPYDALEAFTPAELAMIFGHSEEDWSQSTLHDSIKADHGYTMESSAIRNLITVLSELNESDRREFLQFITGSPKLPIGGFSSLTPQFTIVCKPNEPPLIADDYLPSVMTCVNYLKLPDYSSLEVLRTRIFTAMKEGGGSFHLS